LESLKPIHLPQFALEDIDCFGPAAVVLFGAIRGLQGIKRRFGTI
jgi:hypothetical protein